MTLLNFSGQRRGATYIIFFKNSEQLKMRVKMRVKYTANEELKLIDMSI